MEHIDDLVFNEGVTGLRKAIYFLLDLRDMLAGHTKNHITATVKWDGAPAIFAGVDPADNNFFVAKKGLFNKNPKMYKTQEDIDSDLSGELRDKFTIALQEFSKLGIKSGVYQGDLMFTQGDLKKETIDGEVFITFHPNTIVYAVSADSTLGKQVNKSRIGVVWHTTYEGSSIQTMKASFGKPIAKTLKKVPSVWMDDATYHDYSGTATFTADETKEVTAILSKAGTLFQQFDAEALNYISNDPDLMILVKTFNNSKIRSGKGMGDPAAHTEELFHYIFDRYQKEIDSKKTDKSKQQWEEKRKKVMSFFAKHDKAKIAKIFEIVKLITEAKQLIINKMNQAGHIKTFLKTASGFQVTGVEGFVAIDHLTGGAVKIVDRMEFSKSNFSADVLKGWQR